MKLPVGSRERVEAKIGLETEIVKLADLWELQRAKLRNLEDLNDKSFTRFIRAADKLSAAIRKWRRL